MVGQPLLLGVMSAVGPVPGVGGRGIPRPTLTLVWRASVALLGLPVWLLAALGFVVVSPAVRLCPPGLLPTGSRTYVAVVVLGLRGRLLSHSGRPLWVR